MNLSGIPNLFAGFTRDRFWSLQPKNSNDWLLVGDRLTNYRRWMRSYLGYSIKGTEGVAVSKRRIKFNFSQPIVNLGAGWLCAQPLDWDVDGDPEATATAYAIWDRSGSDSAMLEAALLGCIYGDIVGIATQNDDKKTVIEFVDPSICFPRFDGSDQSKLVSLDIAWVTEDENERQVRHREMYLPNRLEVYENDTLIRTQAYDEIPAVWIKNHSIKGQAFGLSDLQNIVDLVEEYDHIASKETRIVDYYSAPTIVFRGIQQSDLDKSDRTAFFLPSEGADAKYLEWTGNTPDLKDQLMRIRNAISEISQVPPVAFGQNEAGMSNLAGVALQILYGPLISKVRRKRASWGPALERLMAICLRAEGRDVSHAGVNLIWPDAMPVDGQAKTADESAKVAAELSSRRTAMNNLGVEDPNAEMKRIVVEKKLLELASPIPDPIKVAKAAAIGSAVAEGPAFGTRNVAAAANAAPGAANQPSAGSGPAPTVPGVPVAAPVDPAAVVAAAMPDPEAEMDQILQQFDAIIEAENESLDAQAPDDPAKEA